MINKTYSILLLIGPPILYPALVIHRCFLPFHCSFVPFLSDGFNDGYADDDAADDRSSDQLHRRHDFAEERVSQQRHHRDVFRVENVADNPGASGFVGFQRVARVDARHAEEVADDAGDDAGDDGGPLDRWRRR